MARVYSNVAVDTTTTGVAAGATTINVASTDGWPTPGAGDVALGGFSLDGAPAIRELFSYTGKTATSFTGCVRGLDGTTDQAHANGIPVVHAGSAADIQAGANAGGGGGGGWTMLGLDPGAAREASTGSTNFAYAGRGHFYEIPAPGIELTVTTAYFRVQAAATAGNVSIALYDRDSGARLATTGAFVAPTTTGSKMQALLASATIAAGTPLIAAVSTDSTSAGTWYGLSILVAPMWMPTGGLLKGGVNTSAHPLPDPLPTLVADIDPQRMIGVWFK